jgi:signal transduction histidine kinase
MSQPELMSIISEYLSSLAQATDRQLGQFSGSRRTLVESHLSARLRQGFDLAEIIEEFTLLGKCIALMWLAAPAEDRPQVEDAEQLFSELNTAGTAVAEMFREHLLNDEQSEKRYVRLLENIASEALAPGAPQFHKRLEEALAMIVEAMNAQSAALLLFDPTTQSLITAASVGAAEEQLERYATSLGSASFPGQIASHEEATSVMDAATTKLEISDGLRGSGIHSLLGVRLRPRHQLLGVLYVGLSETRAFFTREIRRIEALGERLTLHLDNAKLHAELLVKIEALSVERDLRELFVSVLAHDLRQPLSAAKISAQALIRHPERLDQHLELAIRINTNIDRTDRMIRDLLDANQIRAGKQLPLRLDRCDLAVIAREVVAELASIHGEQFVLKAEEGVRGIWSADVLRRALWNLAANAIKYGAPDQPVTITVRGTDDGAQASVHNFGSVLSRQDQAYLFEPFARSLQAGGTRGWGLGLTLVHGCAHAHGGTVKIESDAAAGTLFTLKLPLDARPFQPPWGDEQFERPPESVRPLEPRA